MMHAVTTRAGIAALALALIAGAKAPAPTQNWPIPPITMVVPFGAGGATDITAMEKWAVPIRASGLSMD